MLHVTSGAAVQIEATGIGGTVMPWDDVLHEGPVPRMPLDELSELRAQFIAQAFGLPGDEAQASFEKRDAALRAFTHHDELVLWFEHDLYDQLQLLQVLAYVSGHWPCQTRVSLIQSSTYLGPMTPAQLSALYPARRTVTAEQLRLAAAAWAAFTAPEPRQLLSLMKSDTSALPYLNAALRRHLQQFPSTREGLSRTERQIVDVVRRGARTLGAAFQADTKLEEPTFMGDSSYALHVRALGTCRRPLLRVDEHGTVMKITLDLTPTGRDVLEGRADHIQLNGIDRWLGGIHLSDPDGVWRFDGETLVS